MMNCDLRLGNFDKLYMYICGFKVLFVILYFFLCDFLIFFFFVLYGVVGVKGWSF